MSREIKFRAMMAEPHARHEGDWVFLNGVGHDHWVSNNGTYRGQLKDETLGEYTGLKDGKNYDGVEIYAGSRIRKHIKDNKRTETIEVTWLDCQCGFNISKGSNHWYEVIGNIHEETKNE